MTALRIFDPEFRYHGSATHADSAKQNWVEHRVENRRDYR
jgi:hypothetical protein